MSDDERSAAMGAAYLVTTGIKVQSGEDALIICDETTQSVALQLAQAAMERRAVPCIMLVPLRQQDAIGEDAQLPSALEAAIHRCTAVFNVLDAGQERLTFRRILLDAAQHHDRAVAHIPGATNEFLSAACVDDQRTDKRNTALAHALALGRAMTVTTTDCAGREYRLRLDLGGWARRPILSGRSVDKGCWGNLPGGEVYIAPVSGDGNLLVDGSVDDMLLDEPLLVSFRAGRMQGFEPEESEAGRFLMRLGDRCAKRKDVNYDFLAEFGIGTNGSIPGLMRSALVNEKVLGTCHVSLGHGSEIDATTDSSVQVKMVCRKPTIEVDANCLIDRGKHIYNLNDPGLDHRDQSGETWGLSCRVAHTGHAYEIHRQRLCRVWHNAVSRQHRFSVGNKKTAQIAARIHQALPVGVSASVADLASDVGLPIEIVAQVVMVMERYQLVEIER